MFHSLKKMVAGSHAHPADPDFDSANDQFQRYSTTINRLRTSCNSYISQAQSMLIAANGISADMDVLLANTDAVNEQHSTNLPHYNELSNSMKTIHLGLVGNKIHEISTELHNEVIKPLDSATAAMNEINTKLSKRTELRGELDYYTDKVHGLQSSRDKKHSSGKVETPKEMEKFDRNQQKLNSHQAEFMPFNQNLCTEMKKLYSNRAILLGPVLNSFARIEKEFANLYSDSLKSINILDSELVQADKAKAGTAATGEMKMNETTGTAVTAGGTGGAEVDNRRDSASRLADNNQYKSTPGASRDVSRDPSPIRQSVPTSNPMENQPKYSNMNEPQPPISNPFVQQKQQQQQPEMDKQQLNNPPVVGMESNHQINYNQQQQAVSQ